MSEKTTINVEGMSCGHCVNAVESIILSLDGIENVNVDLGSKAAHVSFNPASTNSQAIIESINSSEIYKATQK